MVKQFWRWWKAYPAVYGAAHAWWFFMGLATLNVYDHPHDYHSWIGFGALLIAPFLCKLLWWLEKRAWEPQ